MLSKSIKRKRIALTVTQKLESIGKLEKGASVTSICEEYGMAKCRVLNIIIELFGSISILNFF